MRGACISARDAPPYLPTAHRQVLHLSEHAAYLRLEAARRSRSTGYARAGVCASPASMQVGAELGPDRVEAVRGVPSGCASVRPSLGDYRGGRRIALTSSSLQ